MLTGPQRNLFAVTASLCIALLLWSGVRWHNYRAAAQEAVRDLQHCQRIAAEIEAARTAPQTALLAQQSEQQISGEIDRAAQAAEIPDTDVQRITPQLGRRIDKSPHLLQPVDVTIRQVTMGQLARFLGELGTMESGLQATSIHLSEPRTAPTEKGNEVWSCELVLTYLVFSPE